MGLRLVGWMNCRYLMFEFMLSLGLFVFPCLLGGAKGQREQEHSINVKFTSDYSFNMFLKCK